MALSPSCIHSHQHTCPVAGFCSAGTGMDGEVEIILIELTIKKSLDLQRPELLLKSCNLILKLHSQVFILFALI